MDQPTTAQHRSSGRRRAPRPKGNTISIALAALAVVIAGTGTAVAVSSTTTISDPKSPSRIAHVDAAGRLTVVGASSSINIATTAYTNASKNLDVFSSPTAATLAVTKFSVVNSANNVGLYAIYFFQVPVNTDGTCSVNITNRTLAYAHVVPNAQSVQDFAAPIVIKPVSTGVKYCLDFYAQAENSSAAPSSEALNVEIVGYVTSGSYTGLGATAVPGRAVDKAQLTAGK